MLVNLWTSLQYFAECGNSYLVKVKEKIKKVFPIFSKLLNWFTLISQYVQEGRRDLFEQSLK